MKKILTLILIGFVCFCGMLVVNSGLLTAIPPCILLARTSANQQQETPVADNIEEYTEASNFTALSADNAPASNVILGSIDPKSGFRFELELTSEGAAVSRAAFSEFDDRDPEEPQPLVILSPARRVDGGEVLSMANADFIFVQQKLKLPLDKLHWKNYGVEKNEDGSQAVRFEATIKTLEGEPVLKLLKTYKINPHSYLMDCDMTVENLSVAEQKVRFDLSGPSGLDRESFRTDMRKVVAGFRNREERGQITSMRLDARKLSKAETVEDRRLIKPGADFLWVAAVNKYFAAILVPVPEAGKDYCDWVKDKTGQFYNPDGKSDTGDETVGVDLKIAPSVLAAAGEAGSAKTYKFNLYLGPKDKALFDKNQMYRNLGFVETIDFLACCCPTAIIHPLAFFILAIMKWMYGFIPNYGVVIIILVFLMRLIMHPITKRSQVSMSKMQTLAPRAEEIKKKYANNKTEMNRQLMALYREQGASPIMGMLPMFLQMPVWIALWSAVYTGIELRGAPFLPFWITDLSVPDAFVRFPTITVPLLGWKIESLNLLPILMGVAFYLQQKLMPKPQTASTNPQVAQQQKMMMIMMPILFPLMLYKAPSGVNLYIMSSVFAGVVEQYFIRKHIREKQEAESAGLVAVTSKTGGKAKKKKPKPFFRT